MHDFVVRQRQDEVLAERVQQPEGDAGEQGPGEEGVRDLVAEGADGSSMTRTIPRYFFDRKASIASRAASEPKSRPDSSAISSPRRSIRSSRSALTTRLVFPASFMLSPELQTMKPASLVAPLEAAVEQAERRTIELNRSLRGEDVDDRGD